MGKKIDALLGRKFKTGKLKPTASLAISRVAVLKNQRRARCSVARSDVIDLLNLGHHDRALLRVEQVMKEQNMVDVLVMVEGYCYLLSERVFQLEHQKECPEELKEAIASLIFAGTRCGDFPELQELRVIFSAQFGKEFTARAVDLRNNCGVNHKMIQKLSTRMPSYESRLMALKQIAKENNIILPTDEEATQEDKAGQADHVPVLHQNAEMEGGRKYKDVADAAQAAFESAAYAAAAARAAVELSRSQGPDHPYTPTRMQTTKAAETNEESLDLIRGTEEDLDVNKEDNGGEDLSPMSVRTKPTYRW